MGVMIKAVLACQAYDRYRHNCENLMKEFKLKFGATDIVDIQHDGTGLVVVTLNGRIPVGVDTLNQLYSCNDVKALAQKLDEIRV